MSQHKRLVHLTIVSIVLAAALLIIFAESWPEKHKQAKDGVMDLRDWNFGKDGTVRLDGEWTFYPNRLLGPDDFKTGQLADEGEMIRVPGNWNRYLHGDGSSDGLGYGTYRLLIRLPEGSAGIFGVKTSNIRMASRVYMNGSLIGSSGRPSDSVSGYEQYNIPYVGFGTVQDATAELIVQVANYSYATGGVIYSIDFGNQQTILKKREQLVVKDVVMIAGLLLLGVFCLLLFAWRREEKGLFFLGLFCLGCMLFMLLQGEKLISVLAPGIPYWLVLKLQLTVSTTVYYVLLRLAVETNPRAAGKKMIRAGGLYTLSVLILIVIVPTLVISEWTAVIFIDNLCVAGVSVYIILKGRVRSFYQDLHGMLTVQCGLVMMITYLFYIFEVWEGLYLIAYEMMVFFIAQFTLFARRFLNSIAQVEKLSGQLIALDKLKDEFIANTTHELRSPVHGIINIAQSMLDGAAGPVGNGRQEHNLSMIVETGKQLSRIINDVLEFAQIRGSGLKLQKRAVQLRPVVQSVTEVVGHTLGNKPVKITLDIPPSLPALYTDEDRLRQIFYNLLSNAVNATDEGEIAVSAVAREGFVTVKVADTGAGMTPVRLAQLFQTDQSEQLPRSSDGSGLGLRIVKQLVELGGGEIRADSLVGRGSVFSFTVPCATAEFLAAEGMQTPEEAGSRTAYGTAAADADGRRRGYEWRIAAVDDDPVGLQVLVDLLSSDRCEVVAMNNPIRALEEILAKGLEYDLVITDWMMPELSGIELCKKIRGRFMRMELPVMLLTAKSSPDDIRYGFEAGVNDYISKPVDPGELRARVSTLLELRRSVKLLVQTEMAFLQAQIKPHFLYNALSTIIAICPVDPNKATELLMELGQFLRGSFDFHNRDKLTTLEHELELVNSYLALEKARYDERLKVEIQVNCSLNTPIPPLTIQPIVENAISHGIMKKEEGGTVRLRITQEEESVVVVEDDGVGFTDKRLSEVLSAHGTGRVGLRNIHKRLMNLYGTGLTIAGKTGQGAAVGFRLPYYAGERVFAAGPTGGTADESRAYR